MVEIGEAFDDVEAEDRKDIIYPYAGFDIRPGSEGIGREYPVCQWELHLRGIQRRIVLISETAIEDLACDDLAEAQSFQPRYLVEKKAIEEMVDIQACIMIADEFAYIHHIIGRLAIEIGRVSGMDDQQRKWKIAAKQARVKRDVGIAERRDIATLIDVQVQGVVVVLSAEHPTDAPAILKRDDGVSVDDIDTAGLVLDEFLVRRPADGGRQLAGGQL